MGSAGILPETNDVSVHIDVADEQLKVGKNFVLIRILQIPTSIWNRTIEQN